MNGPGFVSNGDARARGYLKIEGLVAPIRAQADLDGMWRPFSEHNGGSRALHTPNTDLIIIRAPFSG